MTVMGIFTTINMSFASFWITMLYHIPEEHNPQPHSCDNLRTQKNKESKCCLNILLLTAVNELDCFISVQSTGAVRTAAQMQKTVLGGLWRMSNISAKNSALWTLIGSVLLF
jgi:hypothetical protein